MKGKPSLRWGLTISLSACVILVFYNTFFQDGVLLQFFRKLLVILKPVIYGFAFAYLLAPVVNFFDTRLRRTLSGKLSRAARALSILITWLLVGLLIYAFALLLFPQLYKSVHQLIDNLGEYYRTIYTWVTQTLNDNPDFSQKMSETLASYYKELLSLIYDKWIPQAQVAVAAVTGGVVSALIFLKDLLVGICVSIYLLGRSETFAAHSRRLLYSMVKPERYERILSGVATADSIFSGFVRGKLLDSLIIGMICLAVCTVARFPYAPLISVIIGVTNIIPFFGPFLGAVPSALLILLVEPIKCLYFIIFIVILQQIDGNILGPKILGNSTGLSGFWIIVAILVGGGFFGVLGMFLGVPVFACIYSAVNSACARSLAKKGVTDEEIFYQKRMSPAPAEDEQGDHHV